VKARWIIYSLIIVLAILHQDFWWWDDPTLVFGFLPIGLAYHGLYSIMASVVWGLALYYCWPHDMEARAEENPRGDHRS